MKVTPHIDEEVHGRVLEIAVHGTLVREDYEAFVPETEKVIARYGKIRVLVTMHDFHGWAAGALWNEIQWNAKHFNQVERLAVVGDKTWHRWMTNFSRAFTTARVRYFTLDQLDDAHAWIYDS
jgi:hypothetical protein